MSILEGKIVKQSKKPYLTIIDTSGVLYTFSTECKDKNSVMLKGVSKILMILAKNRYENRRTVLVMDSFSQDRKESDSDYKANRTFNPYIKFQSEFIKTFFEKLGADIVYKSGYEADDLIYSLVYKYVDDYTVIDVMTDDKDNYGVLISYNVNIVGIRKSSPTFGPSSYKGVVSTDIEIPCNSILPYLTLFGKPSNNLKPLKLSVNKKLLFKNFLDFCTKNNVDAFRISDIKVLKAYLRASLNGEEDVVGLTLEDIKTILERSEVQYPKLYSDIDIGEAGPDMHIDYVIDICKRTSMDGLIESFGLSDQISKAEPRNDVKIFIQKMNIEAVRLEKATNNERNFDRLGTDIQYTKEFIDMEDWDDYEA